MPTSVFFSWNRQGGLGGGRAVRSLLLARDYIFGAKLGFTSNALA